MDKTFSPQTVEPRWRARWEELGIGVARAGSDRPTFVIAMPPPNITGVLHMGHACSSSIQDILVRHRRMLGHEVEWCPGTDHAAIATQNVIERQLAAEGTTKEQLGRAGFQVRVDQWYEEYGGTILEQMRRLGFSFDASRTRFTLDPAYVHSIRTAFKALYDEGLIYRGPRIVNWCPRCLSAISDEEVEWQEHTDTLVQLRYPVEGGGEVVVATVRPETMLGDTGVAVAPGDPRYAALVGRTAVLPLTGRRVPIVEDSAVEPEFGTGALKVTPAHDATDYDIGQRHGLPMISVIALDGTMDVPELPRFHGLTVAQARREVTEALREAGAVVGEEEYLHSVGHCDRCGEVLEPLISEQWWVRMEPLAGPAIAAVEEGRITFHPARYGDMYLSWMRGLRDWCISRQIWLGHSIPVSTCANGHTFAWVEPPASCPVCGSTELTHDPDVLDTWFSSALWPFAIFGWPLQTADLARFYPTDVLVTGRDIIALWVARMIMTGLRFTGVEPFHDVVINSIIQAHDGSRMSKSKGNAIDPMDMIELYGADAVRAWAGAVGTAGQDMRFDVARIQSYQRFANKLWNVTRLLVSALGEGAETIPPVPEVGDVDLAVEDRWMLARLDDTVRACDASIASYRFHEAMERLYDTVWHAFCDVYVEAAKPRLAAGAAPHDRAAAASTAVHALDVLLRLLHPFMPFVTEECAQRLPAAAATLQHRAWPRPVEASRAGVDAFDALVALAAAVRAAKRDAGAGRGAALSLRRAPGGLDGAEVRRLLAQLSGTTVVEEALPGTRAVEVVEGAMEAALHLAADVGAPDRARHQRRVREVDGLIASLRARLEDSAFAERAPQPVVDRARAQLSELEQERAALRRILDEDAA